ncbi:lysophospholipid acyltransferase family protein [Lentisalinibacter salinarum]|uniref:lysophospholipid acyltransferase family protein n=1 Tax=Lentisalinibacter salinarum TaxID=2992239 RepID=UPI00386D7923
MQMLRSIVFTVWLFVSVPFYVFALLLLAPLPHRVRYPIAVAWVRQVMWVMRHLVGLDYRVVGRENIPDEASVVLLKHSSTLETLAELLLFPPQTWVLKRELMFAPFFGWGIALLKPIAINRGAGRSAVRQVISQGSARLREGIWVMIFPEGTRMPAGQTRRYGVSGAALAAASGRKIVPVAHDAGHYWPRRGWLKKPGTVTFVIGEPVDAEGRDPREVNREIQDWIEKTIRNIDDIAESAAEAERDAGTRAHGMSAPGGEGKGKPKGKGDEARDRRTGPGGRADKREQQNVAGETEETDGPGDGATASGPSRSMQSKRADDPPQSAGSADKKSDSNRPGGSRRG